MNKKYIAPTVEITEIPEEVIIATSDGEIKAGVGEGSHVADTKMFDFSSEDEDFDF